MGISPSRHVYSSARVIPSSLFSPLNPVHGAFVSRGGDGEKYLEPGELFPPVELAAFHTTIAHGGS